eukprot:CAMPEP_0182572724 /NCGR_PEP_ID=MMETSP1324-20130603/17859_1 /TAXON_ID=236786 /ORGANISM="Florenciella sp., Strain RCC1587" /LENGTH=304 /DNA_ID=CAMNT_0024787729 /DNA_START=59 /DNA_END=973 /DNA_ORIENTATION=-
MARDTPLTALNYANVAAYILNAFVTYLVGTTDIFGRSNEYVSAKYQTIITPAGYAFAIWGIIFTLELLFVIVQCTQAVRATDVVQKGVGWAWVSACVFQTLWTLAFAQEKIMLSTVLITGIFLSLGVAVKRSASMAALESYDFICRVPLAIHFSWLAAATALNVNIMVVDNGGSVSDQLAVGFVALALVLVNACLIATKDFKGRAVPAAVAAWAVAAIGSELSTPMNKEICEAATGGDDCNMISEIFDADTIAGVQKTAYALAVVSAATVLLAVVAGLTKARSAASSSAAQLVLPTLKAPLIQY